MTWVKLDDQWTDHPKFLKLGDLGELLWVKALTYACRYRTKGIVPREILPKLTSLRSTKLLEAKLVESGLWFICAEGYKIHDFDKYQPTPDKLSEARSLAGKAGAAKRWQPDGNLPSVANSNVDSKLVTTHSSRAPAPGRVGEGSGSALEGSAEGASPEPFVHEGTQGRIPEDIWDELWKARYGRPFLWSSNTGPKGEVSQLHALWRQAEARSPAGPELRFRHWLNKYLRDQDPWCVERSHPVIGIASRVNQYEPGTKPAASKAPYHVETPMDPALLDHIRGGPPRRFGDT